MKDLRNVAYLLKRGLRIFLIIVFIVLLTAVCAYFLMVPVVIFNLGRIQHDVILNTPKDIQTLPHAIGVAHTIVSTEPWLMMMVLLIVTLMGLTLKSNKIVTIIFYVIFGYALGNILFIVRKSVAMLNNIDAKWGAVLGPKDLENLRHYMYYADLWEIFVGMLIVGVIVGVIGSLLTSKD